jgi:hypothetical protein
MIIVMDFSQAELSLVVVVIELDCLGIEVVSFLEVLLVMLDLPLDEVEVTSQTVNLPSEVRLVFLVVISSFQVFSQS